MAFKPPKLFSTYDPIYVEPTHNDMPSMTKQAFLNDCDINVLKKRFVQENGFDPIIDSQQQYEIDFSSAVSDFSDIHSLADVFDVADLAETAFHNLPPEIRAKVHNDPREFKRLVSTMSDNELGNFGLFNSMKGGQDNAPTPNVEASQQTAVQTNSEPNSQA